MVGTGMPKRLACPRLVGKSDACICLRSFGFVVACSCSFIAAPREDLSKVLLALNHVQLRGEIRSPGTERLVLNWHAAINLGLAIYFKQQIARYNYFYEIERWYSLLFYLMRFGGYSEPE